MSTAVGIAFYGLVCLAVGVGIGEILSERRRLRAERDGRIEWERVGPRVVPGGKPKREAAHLSSKGVA